MKLLIAIFLTLAIPAATAHADLCIKQRSHTDGYYYGGVSTPPEDEETEMWIGADRMAVIGENTSVIIDAEAKLMYFVNHRDSTYAEIATPMDWSQVVNEQLLGRLQMFQRQGEVKATGETRKIGKWDCEEYAVYSWIPYMDIRYDERELKLWATRQVPIELAVYGGMSEELGKIRNYSDALIEEFKKIEGVTIAAEGVIYMKGFSVDTRQQLVEAYKDDAPEGVYSVPEGYKKKDQLTIQDLRD